MENYGNGVSDQGSKLPAPCRRWNRWLVVGGLALAFALTMMVGALLGGVASTSQAASSASATAGSAQSISAGTGNASSQALVVTNNANNPQSFAAGPAQGQGQCERLTVSSVSGSTIIAKAANGSSVTIHTTSSTKYTQVGKSAAASAIKTGSVIQVMGTHNSDGSITATSIDIG